MFWPTPDVVPQPLQAPKDEPANAVAVTVTMLLVAKAWAQSSPHAMPAGALTAIPDPEPFTFTVSFAPTKLAVTVFVAVSVTTHGPVGFVQAPLQPPNVRPGSGVAVSVTSVPVGNTCAHSPGRRSGRPYSVTGR